ncbi:hypothetical protein CC1G_11048 [Coprinopsis cinerea okayama7|uniref:Uncharacterized protein n=1 Tax=Coprinopsis cinerea (strain Okayama-7 / 130 / ATCC MYA-4618 / FGSC 9003) TaxID=240176 RepID=A8NIU9_COPC7|nr:hypothetical protein CC1G_11048 [Coprinopsis cinerea okayama7\|eukprot:XP_001834078.1 hypothetical protein CC1G_11048 [Coprinopsis cinerea okayama7\
MSLTLSALRSKPIPVQQADFLRVSALWMVPALLADAIEEYIESIYRNYVRRFPRYWPPQTSRRRRRRAKTKLWLKIRSEMQYYYTITCPNSPQPSPPMTWDQYVALDTRLASTQWDEVAEPLLEALNNIPDNERLAYIPAIERPEMDWEDFDYNGAVRANIEQSLRARGITRRSVRNRHRNPADPPPPDRSDDDDVPRYIALASRNSDDDDNWSDTPGPNDGWEVLVLDDLWDLGGGTYDDARGIILLYNDP